MDRNKRHIIRIFIRCSLWIAVNVLLILFLVKVEKTDFSQGIPAEVIEKVAEPLGTGFMRFLDLVTGNQDKPFFTEVKTEVNLEAYPDYAKGMAYWTELRYPEVEQCLSDALAACNAELGESSLQAAAVSQKLGALYLEEGRYNDAYECLNSSYVTFRDKLGTSDGQTIIAKAQIACCDVKRGNIDLGERALEELYEETNYFAYKIQILSLHAECEIENGNYAKEKKFYDYCVNFFEQFGIPSEYYVVILNDYGMMLRIVGDYPASEACLLRAVEVWNQLGHEQENGKLANVYFNLAQNYSLQDNHEKAMEYAQKALAVSTRLYGENSVMSAHAFVSLADIYNNINQPQTEKEWLDKALDVLIAQVGENHASTASVYTRLGDWYRDNDALDTALDHHQKALEIRRNILGVSSLDTVDVYWSLAEDCRMAGDIGNALAYIDEAMEICRSFYGKDNRYYVQCCDLKMRILLDADRAEEALAEAKAACQVCDMQKERIGCLRADTYQLMGRAKLQQDEYQEAVRYFEKSTSIYHSLNLGNAYTDYIAMNHFWIGDAYRKQNNIAECEKWYRSGYALSLEVSGREQPRSVTDRLRLLYNMQEQEVHFGKWLLQWRQSFEEDAQNESGT